MSRLSSSVALSKSVSDSELESDTATSPGGSLESESEYDKSTSSGGALESESELESDTSMSSGRSLESESDESDVLQKGTKGGGCSSGESESEDVVHESEEDSEIDTSPGGPSDSELSES